MKKFLFFLTVGLVLVLLAAPWLLGSFTESRIEETMTLRDDADPGIAVVTEEYRRRWFSSDSRHRVVVTDPRMAQALRELAGGETFADQPALIIDTRIEHGPLTSGADGARTPGLSRAVSTFTLEAGNRGDPIPLPGRLVTTMALDGSTDLLFTMESGVYRLPERSGTLSWQGAHVEGNLSPDARTVTLSGIIRPIRLEGVENRTGAVPVVDIGAIDLVSEQRYTVYGIPVGSAAAEIAHVTVDGGTAGIRAEEIRFSADSGISDDLLSATTELRIARLRGPGDGTANLAIDVELGNLHAPSLQAIAETGRRLQAKASAVSKSEWYRAVEADLARLVEAGPVLDLRDLVLGLPDGEARLKSYVAIAAGGAPVTNIDARALIDRLTATLELRVPEPLLARAMEIVPEFAEELEMLVAMGVLREDEDDYRLEAEYGNRLLTINGLPVPIPFGL
ncbi:MAG: DUF945 family protein [Gammaproteobacteria bacterium]